MIRAAHLAPSRPMYAFDPTSWKPVSHRGFEVDAAWFKRKRGQLVAVMGTYHPMVLGHGTDPTDGQYETWIAAANDNRYGGSWIAQSNGIWLMRSDQSEHINTTVAMSEFLHAMLKGFPDTPAGYDGWWTFPRPEARRA